MNKLIQHIENALNNTDIDKSKIDESILKMRGMSGKKTRHFYNNICSMEDARYLEIGTWEGSSLCAAMSDNKMTCLAIDNWSEFAKRHTRMNFLRNFNKYKGDNNATFIESDCWDIDATDIGKFNIYMYDGNHTETSHFQAINHFLPALEDEFIYLVDDWNHPSVQLGTFRSIEDNNLEIVYQKEILTKVNPGPQIGRKINDWHNGIVIFVLRKV